MPSLMEPKRIKIWAVRLAGPLAGAGAGYLLHYLAACAGST